MTHVAKRVPDVTTEDNGTASRVPELSAEVYSIPLDQGGYLIYAPVRRAAFVSGPAMVNLLADLREGQYQAKESTDDAIEFLRRLEIVDGGPEHLPIETYTGDPEPTSVTLFLTTICNLRCTYCYASAGELPVKSMKLETAKRGIDFVLGNALSRGFTAFEVGYHGGGEPTVHWEVMTAS